MSLVQCVSGAMKGMRKNKLLTTMLENIQNWMPE